MLKGFRDFLMRGNVIDLAVAVVVGTAFTALVAAVTKGLIQPLINLFLGGGVDGGKVVVSGQTFDVGGVINAIITFLITAAVVYFLIVVPLKKINERRLRGEVVDDVPASGEAVLLAEIRDELVRQRGDGRYDVAGDQPPPAPPVPRR